jgi:hypothetical protein
MKLDRYELVTGDTVITNFESNHEMAKYHYFNANGVSAKHREMMSTLLQLAEDGIINSGWLLSHDSDYHLDHLMKFAMQQRCRLWDVRYHVNEIRKDIDRAYTRAGEVLLGLRDKAGRTIGLVDPDTGLGVDSAMTDPESER